MATRTFDRNWLGDSYTSVAKLLHWLIALLLLVTIPAGVIMLEVGPGPVQNLLFILHKGIGATLILLVALRILWRATHPPPRLVGLPDWQIRASKAVHHLLYVMLVVMVASGYVRTVAGGYPIELLDALGIPPLLGKNKTVEDIALWVHFLGANVIGALIFLHVGAALHHLLVRKDHVFWRMWPGRG